MIFENCKIYSKGLLKKGVILIKQGKIQKVVFNPSESVYKEVLAENSDEEVIDCQSKIILPGIIDVHSHLRDLNQAYKETFLTGTKAAGFSGITTVFNMPNTDPPANTYKNVKKWIKKAKENIYVNVGFISGVPKDLDENEIKKIIELGIIGFKIYPHSPINNLNWKKKNNFYSILDVSSRYQKPIFIHPDWGEDSEPIISETNKNKSNPLKIHDRMHPIKSEIKYLEFSLKNYIDFTEEHNLKPKSFPRIHFCHISSRQSYNLIIKTLGENPTLKISFEITPHHLLLSNNIELENPSFGKVLPPLREPEHSEFLFQKIQSGDIIMIGTDHAPHSKEEKSKNFSKTPSGFPGFETYPLLLLDKVCNYKLSLANFVKLSAETPAQIFNLSTKGFIEPGFDADFVIVDKVSDYPINPNNFKTKAKYSPFEGYKTAVQIWATYVSGKKVDLQDIHPLGKIIKN